MALSGWNSAWPVRTTSPSASTVNVLANWEWLQYSLSAEHTFPGVEGSTAGVHLSGRCGVVIYDTYTNIDALTDISAALAWATDNARFYVNTGSGWTYRGPIEAGSRAFFYQSSAPTLWTLVTTYHDRCILLESTASQGYTTLGSWVMSGLRSTTHTHIYEDAPSHTHSYSFGTSYYGGWSMNIIGYQTTLVSSPAQDFTWAAPAGAVTSATTSTGQVTNGSGSGTWRPAYASVIMCTKD